MPSLLRHRFLTRGFWLAVAEGQFVLVVRLVHDDGVALACLLREYHLGYSVLDVGLYGAFQWSCAKLYVVALCRHKLLGL